MQKFKKWFCDLNPLYHSSFLIQGLLQVLLAIAISVFFPLVQESIRASNQQKAEHLKKQEEILTKFCTVFSYTLTINDEMRACQKRANCNTLGVLGDSCKEVLAKGTSKFLAPTETLDSLCKIASIYFSKEVSDKLETLNDGVDSLLSLPIPFDCGVNNDKEYFDAIKELSGSAFKGSVAMMKGEIDLSRKQLR